MKQFLYLDTDIVNSIIAQSEKGLIQEQSEENGSDKKKGTHISGSMEGSGTAGGSFLKLAKAEPFFIWRIGERIRFFNNI
jgi:hypothetical protein